MWSDALQEAVLSNASQYKGHDDWRVPTLLELGSLVRTNRVPTIDADAFPNTPEESFWTSDERGVTQAYVVNFSTGSVTGWGNQTSSFAVRLVRNGPLFDLLNSASVTVNSASQVTLNATLTTTGSIFWVVLPQGHGAPQAKEVLAGLGSGGAVGAVAAGQAAVLADEATNMVVTGLSAETAYDLYLVGQDGVGTLTPLHGPIRFSTLEQGVAPAGVTSVPALSGWGVVLLALAVGCLGWSQVVCYRRGSVPGRVPWRASAAPP